MLIILSAQSVNETLREKKNIFKNLMLKIDTK